VRRGKGIHAGGDLGGRRNLFFRTSGICSAVCSTFLRAPVALVYTFVLFDLPGTNEMLFC